MNLKIDQNIKVDQIGFLTMADTYSEVSSPRSVVKQSGLEFDHYRIYQPSDDARLIDWVASARSTETLVRVYSEDISMKVLIVLDEGESMVYGTGSKAKIEFAIELAFNLAWGIISYGDSLGFLSFNEDIISAVPIGIGERHFPEISHALLNTKKIGGKKDLSKALNWIAEFYRGTHLVIFISDFLGFGKNMSKKFYSIMDKFDILSILVYDKSDMNLYSPSHYMNAKSPFNDESGLVNVESIKENYKNMNEKRVKDLNDFFITTGKDLWTFSTEDNIEEKIPQHLTIRNTLRK